ncbi:theronine dehydrogenase-like Zn-dependent dehydrogenase [Salinarchaeum sp. Harcht-Bsk1]|uniref:glucose 1-dehydrogenase n=1 Tax=Salinarchaeum sp. Harcht-Bsk1 TaxID=1333523 RepID=UPI00034243AB|nr:glucose 1-dehydrogenase [Salinarchaeum sp. Harcht-Bsk1]AGN00089.1 theronine dehydrogenase-like Zn-dependent dehydrogenase [Salinarchaeum sp. Harcht-Bsk1]
MRAIAVGRGETDPTVVEIDEPEPAEGEALIRTLRVGIDGTDHEVIGSNHGGYPEGEDFQVLGHEAIGVVEDPNGTDLEAGQLVVPTVRRPPGGDAFGSGAEPNEYFERNEPDMAPAGEYVERGIAGAHGYMAEYFTSEPRYLVPVPDEFAEIGFLVEPISNSEKAFDLAEASRSTFEWDPESAIVLGNGPLGLLTLAMLDDRGFDRHYCLGRRDRPDPTIDIIEELGATYVDSRETPVDELPGAEEPMDFVYEATGYAPHAFQTIDALAPNGVGVLLGIPGEWEFEIDGGALHRDFVLENKALLGSVNSHVPHFEAAVETLAGMPEWFTDAIVTHVFDPEDVDEAFETGDDRIKVVVEFDDL